MSELACYLIVNSSLKMSKGKIGSQCGHAISSLFQVVSRKNKWFKEWLSQGEPIICLKASNDELIDLVKEYGLNSKTNFNHLWGISIYDAGKTEVKDGSLTVFALRPIAKSVRPKWLTNLKLL